MEKEVTMLLGIQSNIILYDFHVAMAHRTWASVCVCLCVSISRFFCGSKQEKRWFFGVGFLLPVVFAIVVVVVAIFLFNDKCMRCYLLFHVLLYMLLLCSTSI